MFGRRCASRTQFHVQFVSVTGGVACLRWQWLVLKEESIFIVAQLLRFRLEVLSLPLADTKTLLRDASLVKVKPDATVFVLATYKMTIATPPSFHIDVVLGARFIGVDALDRNVLVLLMEPILDVVFNNALFHRVLHLELTGLLVALNVVRVAERESMVHLTVSTGKSVG
jgi:hypothetical protein